LEKECNVERILITGANRGLGLEFTRQYMARGTMVLAGCRHPDQAADLQELSNQHPGQLVVLPLVITDQASIERSANEVGEMVGGLDILINNAGQFPRGERPGILRADVLLDTFAVNSVAPLMIAQAYLDLLKAGSHPRIINITSQLGSLARKQSGGNYSYCGSKAALNMLTRALAFDVRALGITAMMMHPGWVKTDMGGASASLTMEESVRGMIRVIDGLSSQDAGRFLQWDGRELPW
jgi:NAD(P)-dependent dehydrogenase (short-subunit alcohol dehydrogenase family)